MSVRVGPSDVIGKHSNLVALLVMRSVFLDASSSFSLVLFIRVGPSDVIGKHCIFVALLALSSVFVNESSTFKSSCVFVLGHQTS